MIPKALQLRADPPLPRVIELEAGVIRSTIAVNLEARKNFSDPLLGLPTAIRQFDPDSEDEMSSLKMSMNDEMMDSMADGSAGSGRKGKKKKKGREKEKNPQLTAEVDAWHGMPGVQEAFEGLRPKNLGISAGNAMALKRNVVVVNALVEHRKLWKEQEQVLSNSVAWYPKRDLPQYEFLQIEKRTIGVDGKPSAWNDVSEWINFDQAEQLNPGSFISGPEVVAPENFDSNLTNAIPAMLSFDYTSYVLHSKLTPRVFKKKEVEDTTPEALDALAGKKTDDEESERFNNFRQNGGRRAKGSLVESKSGGMGSMMATMSDNSDSMGMMSRFGPRGDGRTSTDMTAYAELTDPSLEPESDYKAVRFFDLRVSTNETATYEYRVRLWLRDPNATDPEAARSGFSDVSAMDDMMGGWADGEARRTRRRSSRRRISTSRCRINWFVIV